MSKSPRPGNSIKVRLDVEFADGATAPVTVIVGDQSRSINPPEVLPAKDGLGYGFAPSSPAPVKVSGTGTSGVICANGSDPESPYRGYLEQVALLVQPPADPISESPSSGAVYTVPDAEGFWQSNSVPTAVCTWPGTGIIFPMNRLVIWRKWELETDWLHSSVLFTGECSDKTECDSQGQMLSQMSGASSMDASGASVIDTAPSAWKVVVSGFRGDGVECFNGTWKLTQFPQTAAGHLAWVAGGDSVQQPRVELFGQACGCTPFELRFSSKGATISYRFSRESWNPIGVNQSGTLVTAGLPEGSEIPGQLQVTPS